MSNLRILIVHPRCYVYGGAERVIVKLLNYLHNKGHQPTFLTQEIVDTKMIDDIKGGNIIIEKDYKKWFYSHIGDFDVFNFHNHPAELLAHPVKTPSVWQCNEPPLAILEGRDIPESEKILVDSYIDIVVVADEYNYNLFRKVYGKEPRINPYGIDYDFFKDGISKDEARTKLNLDQDAYYIIQPSFFTFTKNQVESVTTLKFLKGKIPNVKLILIGYDQNIYRNEVERLAVRMGINDDIIYKGFIPQSELKDYYYASDVALFPIQGQGGYLSIFETITCCLPIVVSTKTPVAKVIKKNNLGVVSNQYANAIVDIYNKDTKFSNGKEWVKNNLTWDRYCDNMLNYFKEVSE